MIKDQLLRVFPVEGVGSGVIIDKKGYILTNNHVIEKANKLRVTTPDGNTYEGNIIGADKYTDLAIIKVDSSDALSHAILGDSDELKIGQIVIAIGNPFGLEGGPSVTAGIISSLNRRLRFENGTMELIQTDAAINPGNSGGPLVNTKGQVIGINTAKMPYAQGIGFAVPINVAKLIINDLINNGRVTNRPWIGISTIKITPELANAYSLPSLQGSLIAEVQKGSPGYVADLRKGDIIELVDGIQIKDPFQISNHVNKMSVKNKITITINRYGKRVDKQIVLMPSPSSMN